MRLDDITSLAYSSYRRPSDPSPTTSLGFTVDYDLADQTKVAQGQVFYDPTMNGGFTTSAGTWQAWSPLAGVWYGNESTARRNDSTITNPCKKVTPCTWSQLLAAFPNIGVDDSLGVVVLNAPPGAAAADSIVVDKLVIGIDGAVTTFDFEASGPAVGSVVVTAPSDSVLATQSIQLTATVLDVYGQPHSATPTWSSNRSTRLPVTSGGLATADTTKGELINVTITASAQSVSGTKSIALVGHPPETLATLPQVYLSTGAPAAPETGGRTLNVAAGGNLQAALDSAIQGDLILLENGATWTNNFILRAKDAGSTKWITIRPANMSGMPAEGSRMTPTIAASVNLPKIKTKNNQAAIETAAGAHHYRLIGIEVSPIDSAFEQNGLVRFDGSQTTQSQIPHHLVLDRSYVHGVALGTLTRCVALNSAHSAVIDSHLSGARASVEAQAIGGWSGPGPFKIVNNYLEAAGENIMFGGNDPGIDDMVSADIEIRRNHLVKLAAWKDDPNAEVKNLFELKAAIRVLVEGNVFESNWADGQNGAAINLKSSNQGPNCDGCVTKDVTFRLNFIKNVGSGFSLAAAPDPLPAVSMHRVTITDNVIANMNTGIFTGDGRGLTIIGDLANVVFAHNTIIGPTNSAVTFASDSTDKAVSLTIRDNIIGGGDYGAKASSIAVGNASINASMMPGGVFAANFIITPYGTMHPNNGFYSQYITAIGFTDASTFNFLLASTSAYKNRSTEGRDIGANITALNAAISGVVVSW